MRLHKYSVEAAVVLSVFLFIAAFGCMIAAFVIAGNAEYDGYAEGFYYDVYEDEGAEYIQLTRCELTGNIEIPEEIGGKPVRGMSSSWRSWDEVNPFFTDPEGVLSVIFPAALQEIGDGVFAGCRNLRALTFPQALQEVGRNAFENCTALQAITLPSGVTSVGENAFLGCTNLRSVALPDSVTSIGRSVFSGCTSLQEVTMPIFLVEFYQNRDWENIIFEDFFESSDEYATITDGMTIHIVGSQSIPDWKGYFKNCMASVINITGSMEKIGSSAFSGCTRLEQVTLPSTVTEIGWSAFEGCTSLEQITIPESVTEIGNAAFEDCASLKQIVLPNSITDISAWMFRNCTNLEQVTIPNSVTEISLSAFSGCTSLESVSLPDGLLSLGEDVFSGCTNLRSIVIPLSVTEISNDAFENCPQLTIYAEAASKPADWSRFWNSDNRPVVWGYRG